MIARMEIARKPEQRVDDGGEAEILATLRKYRTLAGEGEQERMQDDERGARLFKGIMWNLRNAFGKQPVNSVLHTALFERMSATVTKYDPGFVVNAVHGTDDEGARYMQGALLTNWREYYLTALTKQTHRLVGFTRPSVWYVYWDRFARSGIGDVRTRLIPAFRTMIDDRFMRIQDMEYRGIKEQCSRAKLMAIYPDKVDAIDAAVAASQTKTAGPSGGSQAGNPLRVRAVDRSSREVNLVSTDGGSTYVPMTGVGTGRSGVTDPLAEQVWVEWWWVDDMTSEIVRRPKRDRFGQLLFRPARDENGDLQFEVKGWDTSDTPFGPVLQPKLELKREPVMEDKVERVYPDTRFVVCVPDDDIILYDSAWDGPIPLICRRAGSGYPLDGYWSTGKALRMASVAAARNVLLTIVQERLKLSLGGTWLATPQSGLRKNKLLPEPGQVFQVHRVDESSIKEFPHTPLDAAYFELIGILAQEMRDLIGISPPMQGEAAGRADSPATYDKLIEQAGTPIVDEAQQVERETVEWAECASWYIKNFYTYEHIVELELDDGSKEFVHADALLMQGDYRLEIEPLSMTTWSESAAIERADKYYAMQIYDKSMYVKVARVPNGREALARIKMIQANPALHYLLPGGGAPVAGKPPGRPGGGKKRGR